MKLYERDFPAKEADNVVGAVMKSMGLAVDETICIPELNVTFIVAIGPDGDYYTGTGKGKHSHIGAKAECIEHYITQAGSAISIGDASSHALARQRLLQNDGVVQSLHDFADHSIPSIEMNNLHVDAGQSVRVPYQLVNPLLSETGDNDAKSFLKKYSTNSGNAFGLSESEALLHGTLETIERHCISRFFLSMMRGENYEFCHYGKVRDIRDCLSVPVPEGAVEEAEVIGGRTIGGAWFFCVIEAQPAGLLARIGMGCSQSANYALERAVTEHMQSVSLEYDEDVERVQRDREAFAFLREFPGLMVLQKLSVVDMPKVEWPVEVQKPAAYETSEALLARLLSNLAEGGYCVLASSEHLGHGAYFVRTCIPGTDRFFLIRGGAKVAPNAALLGRAA